MTTRRIVVAEDNRLILAMFGQGLRGAGYVLEASDGQVAVHLCETAHPDLAILDTRMPVMSGIEAAHAIHEGAGVPLIFLSARRELIRYYGYSGSNWSALTARNQ